MSYKRLQFAKEIFDEKLWYRHYHRIQVYYLRIRLHCLRYFSKGHSFSEIAIQLDISERSVRNAINMYLTGSYELLLTPITRKRPTLLSSEQEQEFKATILTTHPKDHQIDANIWTGAVMISYIQNTYGVIYKSGIYELLYRLNLSHQRAHADYSNADLNQQADFLKELDNTLCAEVPTTAIVFLDEFSVCEKPTAYYGWAIKNTRPTVSTNEKKVNV